MAERGAVPSTARPAQAGPSSRVQRKRQRKVREIVLATAGVLAESGYHAMSMEEVAGRLDLTKGSLYHYFPAKDELVRTCLVAIADEVRGRLLNVLETVERGTARERLSALLMEQLRIVVFDHPEAGRLFAHPYDWPESHRPLVRELRRDHDKIFRDVVVDGVRAGEFGDIDIDIAMHCIHGAINDVPIWLSSRSAAKARETCEAVVRHVVRILD